MSQSVTATRTRTNTRTGHCRQEYTHRCLSSMPIKISNTGDTLLWGRAWGIGTTEHATRAVERALGEEREGEEGTEVKHTLRATTYEPLISRETRVLVSLWRKLFPILYTSIYRLSCIRKASVFEKLSVHPLARTPPRKPTRKNTSRYRKCPCLVSVRDMGGIVVSMGPPSPVHHLRAHATQVVPDVPLTRGVADHPLLGDGLDTQPCQRQEEGGG